MSCGQLQRLGQTRDLHLGLPRPAAIKGGLHRAGQCAIAPHGKILGAQQDHRIGAGRTCHCHRTARDHRRARPDLRRQHGAAPDEAGHPDSRRSGINLLGAGALQKPPLGHNGHTVRHRQRLALIMGDVQHCRAAAALKVGQFMLHGGAQVRI